jgi:subtilase family serine protease
MSRHSATSRRSAFRLLPPLDLLSMSRRNRLVVAGTAVGCLVLPAAAAQAVGSVKASVSPSGSVRQSGSPLSPLTQPSRKFGAAATAVGKGATPAARARIMTRLTGRLPDQVAAYDVKPLWNKGITGQGTSIATIVSFGDPHIQRVIDAYDRANGLPKAHVTILAPVGDPSCPRGHQGVCGGWAGETDLDVAMFHTLAPGAHIYVVATPVAETLGLHGFPKMMKAIDHLIAHQTVDVISMSLSATEETFNLPSEIKGMDGTFRRARAAGIPIVAASGDDGATGPKRARDGGGVYGHRVVGWPASDPLVTAVGGTVLHVVKGHRTAPDSLVRFSGGGFSHVYARPKWQSGIGALKLSRRRAMPDVVMQGTDGTSMSAPLFAAILSLATQENGGKPLGFLNPTLYALGPLGAKAGFVDVTKGNNTWQGVTGYRCKKGYDLPSAYGTVDGAVFVPALVKALPS